MRSMVIYDSAYGNTAQIAKTIAHVAGKFGEAKTVLATEFSVDIANHADVIFIGSPTQGGMPTKPIQAVISSLRQSNIGSVRIAAFDTRYAINDHGFWLKLLMGVIGFAAPKIATAFKNKKSVITEPAAGFVVNDSKGPLAPGEIQHAERWARTILERA